MLKDRVKLSCNLCKVIDFHCETFFSFIIQFIEFKIKATLSLALPLYTGPMANCAMLKLLRYSGVAHETILSTKVLMVLRV